MAINQAMKFLAQVQDDKNLIRLLISLPDTEARLALAGQLGFQMSLAELQQALIRKTSSP